MVLPEAGSAFLRTGTSPLHAISPRTSHAHSHAVYSTETPSSLPAPLRQRGPALSAACVNSGNAKAAPTKPPQER